VQSQQLWLLLQGAHVLLRVRQQVKQLAALKQLQVVRLGTRQQLMQQHARTPAVRHQQQPAQQMHKLGSSHPMQKVRNPCERQQQQRLQQA
jgi:hypothetical protein